MKRIFCHPSVSVWRIRLRQDLGHMSPVVREGDGAVTQRQGVRPYAPDFSQLYVGVGWAASLWGNDQDSRVEEKSARWVGREILYLEDGTRKKWDWEGVELRLTKPTFSLIAPANLTCPLYISTVFLGRDAEMAQSLHSHNGVWVMC